MPVWERSFVSTKLPGMDTQAHSAESSNSHGTASVSESNTVALLGVILIGVAIGLCGLLFAMANHLHDGIPEFNAQDANSPVHLRLLILGCSTAVLSLVAFILCTVGLFLPNRPRMLAAIGLVLSLFVLLGVFGVLLVGVLMNPADSSTPITEPSSAAVTADPVLPESL